MRHITVIILCLFFAFNAVSQQRGIKLTQIIAADTSGYCIVTDTAGFQQYVLCDSLPSNFECEELDSCSIFALGDVDSTGILDGDVLIWNDITGIWEPGQQPSDQTLSINDNMDGTVDISITSGNTIIVDVCDVVASNCNASLMILQDSIIQFTDNGGVVFTDTINIDVSAGETVTTLSVDYNAGTITYTNEASTVVIVDMCRIVDSCETVTTLTVIQDSIIVYTDENGVVTQETIHVAPQALVETLTVLSADYPNSELEYVDENGATTVISMCPFVDSCETLTILTINGSDLEYTDEDGNITNLPLPLGGVETLTTLVADYPNSELEYTDELGATTVIDMCEFVDSCAASFSETLTSLTVVQDTIIQYTDENGNTSSDTIHIPAQAPAIETLTTLVADYPNSELEYTDENSATTVINMCPFVDSCETLTVLQINGGNLDYTDEDGNTVNLPLPLGGIETITTLAADYPNSELEYTDENGATTVIDMCEFVDSCETVTTLTLQGNTILRYVNEDSTITLIDVCTIVEDFCEVSAAANLQLRDDTDCMNTGVTTASDIDDIFFTNAIGVNVVGGGIAEVEWGGTLVKNTCVNTFTTGNNIMEFLDEFVATIGPTAGTYAVDISNKSFFFPAQQDGWHIFVDDGGSNFAFNGAGHDNAKGPNYFMGVENGTNTSLIRGFHDSNEIRTTSGAGIVTFLKTTNAGATISSDGQIWLETPKVQAGNVQQGDVFTALLNTGSGEWQTMGLRAGGLDSIYIELDSIPFDTIYIGPAIDALETVTTLTLNAPSFGTVTLDYVDENGALFSYDVCSAIDSCLTAPKLDLQQDSILSFNNGFGGITQDTIFWSVLVPDNETLTSISVVQDSILQYIDEDGNTSIDTIRIPGDDWGGDRFFITDGVSLTQVNPTDIINFADNANINAVVSGLVVSHFWIGGIAAMNDVDTTGQQIGDVLVFDGADYVPQSGVVLSASDICDSVATACNTSLVADYALDKITFTDNAGNSNDIDICEFVDSCETVTSLAFSNPDLTFTDEDGFQTVLNLSAINTDVSAFSIVSDTLTLVEGASTYKVALIDIAPFQAVVDGNTINFTLNAIGNLTGEVLLSGDAGNILTTGTDNALAAFSVLTTLSADYPNSELDYLDEDAITTQIDMCPFVDSCETVTTLAADYPNSELEYTDEDGVTTVIDMCEFVDSCETVTSIAIDAPNAQIEYTDEDGNVTELDICPIVDTCINNSISVLSATLKSNQTITGTTDTMLLDSILIWSPYAISSGDIDTTGMTTGQYLLSNGYYRVQCSALLFNTTGTPTFTYEVHSGSAGTTVNRPTAQSVKFTGTTGLTSPLSVVIDATTTPQKVLIAIVNTSNAPVIAATKTLLTIEKIR